VNVDVLEGLRETLGRMLHPQRVAVMVPSGSRLEIRRMVHPSPLAMLAEATQRPAGRVAPRVRVASAAEHCGP
jgi:hypothetical protein